MLFPLTLISSKSQSVIFFYFILSLQMPYGMLLCLYNLWFNFFVSVCSIKHYWYAHWERPGFFLPGLKPSRIRAVAKVAAPHFHSHACQRLKGLKPLKHLLASSPFLHSTETAKGDTEKERAAWRMREGWDQQEGGLHLTDTSNRTKLWLTE